VDQAFDITNSFDLALEHSAAYLSHEKGMSAAAAVAPRDIARAYERYIVPGPGKVKVRMISFSVIRRKIINVSQLPVYQLTYL